MDVLNCFGQRCGVICAVELLTGSCGVRVNRVWCIVNGLFYWNVPEAVVFVFVSCHDDGTIVYDVAFVLSKYDLTSGVAHLCD